MTMLKCISKLSKIINSVLRTLVGIYLHFKDHPEPEVATKMTVHVEKWWKGAYQPLFLLCQILNPFESFSQEMQLISVV